MARMNAPKFDPCVFVADGKIYALGSVIQHSKELPSGCKDTGVFECYDPSSDHWHVLRDPPIPASLWKDANLVDQATVVGRRVIIGASIQVIFNLDDQSWDPVPSSELKPGVWRGSHFPLRTGY